MRAIFVFIGTTRGISLTAADIRTACGGHLYVARPCLRALRFGRRADRFGRKKLASDYVGALCHRDRGHGVLVRAVILLPGAFLTGMGSVERIASCPLGQPRTAGPGAWELARLGARLWPRVGPLSPRPDRVGRPGGARVHR